MSAVPARFADVAASRADVGHYTPSDLPDAFVAFEAPIEGLGVGRPGKVGLLELTFAPVNGMTRVVHQFQQFPLQVFRPFHLDPHLAEMAFVYVMSHGGTLQGDRTRIDVDCMPGASAHVTTQAAPKLYRMEHNYATQLVHLRAAADSVLEYVPDPVIPFRDSRFYSRVDVTLDPSATAIIGETLLAGRVAYGEHHDYTCFASRLSVRSEEGHLWFTDAVELSPSHRTLGSLARFGGEAVLASLYVVSRKMPARALAERLHACVSALPDIRGGASELPNGCGAWVRVLGPTSATVAAALHAAWGEARIAVLGAPVPNRRKT